MKTNRVLQAAVVVLYAQAAYCAGTSSALFLREEPTAAMFAMGGVAAAVYDEAGAVYLNPAGLGYMKSSRATLSTWKGVDEKSRYNFVSAIFNADWAGTINLNYLSHNSGSDDVFDLNGNQSSVELAKESALGFGWGHALGENFALGAQIKSIDSKLAESYSASAVTFDAGAMVKLLDGRFSLGAGIRNATGELTYISDGDPLPRVIYGGAAARFNFGPGSRLLLAADLRQPKDETSPDASIGAQYDIGFVSARFGVKRVSRENSITTGAGLMLKWASIDYGFQPQGQLEQAVHKLTLSIYFNTPDSKKPDTAQTKQDTTAEPSKDAQAPAEVDAGSTLENGENK